MKILKLLENQIFYGPITSDTVRELIVKEGFVSVNGQKIALQDNNVIEEQLGKLDILCTEDLVYELVNCTDKVKDINRFLCVFQLKQPQSHQREWKFTTGFQDKMDEVVKDII